MRGALYIDGFNLYHAIDDLGKPYLKWLNLWRMGELVARGHARRLERAVFCSAYFPGDHGKKVRHKAYIDALENVGVQTRLGHTTKEPMECKRKNGGCGHRWDQPREKETDINLSLAILEDAYEDVYDVAFIVTADTDQAGTLKFMRRKFPYKKTIMVVPPMAPGSKRAPSKHLRDLSNLTIQLTESHLDACVFPGMVMADGRPTVVRPHEYAPADGWVHPDDRPA